MANGSNQQRGLTVLRVIVGAIFLVHGAQKLFVFGFYGVAGMLGGMGIPVPAVSAAIPTVVEFPGGIALILCVVSSWAAAPVSMRMIVAALLVFPHNGFFQPKGYRNPLSSITAC